MEARYRYVLDCFRSIYGVPDDVVIAYGDDPEGAPVTIRRSGTTFFDGDAPRPAPPPVWRSWHNRQIPFLFDVDDGEPVLSVSEGRAVIHYDLLASAFYFLSGWQEHVYMRRYAALRYPWRESLQHHLDITGVPVVNYYFDILRHAVEQACSIRLVPGTVHGGHAFTICLTHDIDALHSGWTYDTAYCLRRRRPRALARVLFHRLRGRDTWDNLDAILAMEKEREAVSSFYFIARYGRVYQNDAFDRFTDREPPLRDGHGPGADFFFREAPAPGYSRMQRNADYRMRDRDLREGMERLHRGGAEIGIHGSFGSHVDLERLWGEVQRFPAPVRGGRFHFLNFDHSRTLDILEELGFHYDSTLGFAEQPGFRNGTAYPFFPWNFREERPYRVLEIPLVLMDTTLRSYTGTPKDEIPARIDALMAETRRFGGCLTVLWHNSFFSGYKYAGWKTLYGYLLEQGYTQGAWMTSAERVSLHWRNLLRPRG